MHACVCVRMCCMSMSMGQVSDLVMDIKRSWPAPHQNPSLEPPPLSHTHPALCRVRECDLVPIPEEGWTLMTASSDTLRSPEPPSPAGPLSPSGRDPLVHIGRGLRSGLDCLARVCPAHTLSHPILPWPAMSRLVTLTQTALSSSSEDSATGCRPVVSVQCTMSAAAQLCVCVFIRGDSYAQWNKDAVNHNQMGVCAGGGGEGGRESEEFGGGVSVPWMFRGMPRSNAGRWRLRAGDGWGLWGTEGWGCVAFGKMKIGVPRPEWKTCLLIEWTQELQQSLIKQEVLSNHCCVPLFHNQERNCNIMRAAWRGSGFP